MRPWCRVLGVRSSSGTIRLYGAIQNFNSGAIFDGFPRTLAQADALADMMAGKGLALDAVVAMTVDDDALVARVTGRFTCGECGEVYHDTNKPPAKADTCDNCGATNAFKRRADDNEDSLKQRLMEYYKKTSPLIGYYYAKGDLSVVDGLGEMDQIARQIPDRKSCS